MTRLHSIYIGQPTQLTDAQGDWRSSIFRTEVAGPVELTARGLAGDRVTDTRYHGSADQAVCCHPMAHYVYWQGLYPEHEFGPGAVGENWPLLDADEDALYIGDIYSVGTAQVQITSPRRPCAKQARKVGITHFHSLSVKALRTGFYLRVLAPGVVEAGDEWRLQARLQAPISVQAVNRCRYATFDAATAARLAAMPELMETWRTWFAKRPA